MRTRDVVFADRDDAGRRLGEHLIERIGFLVPDAPGEPLSGRYARRAGTLPGVKPLALALPRGGVPVAAHVAAALNAQLDIVCAGKIGAPDRPEYGIGALAEDGPPIFDTTALRSLGLSETDLTGAVERERAEVRRRARIYRNAKDAPKVSGRIVVLVDDGLATGVTARAALRWLHDQEPAYLVLAAPVCSRPAHASLSDDADAVVCLQEPENFRAVGDWYEDFRQLTDEEVNRVLGRGSSA